MRVTRRYGRRRYFNLRRRGRRTRGQIRRLAWAWGAAIAAALALALAAGLLLSQSGGRPGFEKGELLVCANGGGDVELYWPKTTAPSALYRLEVRCGDFHSESYASRPAARFSGLPAGEKLEVRVWAAADGKDVFGNPKKVKSRKTFKAGVILPEDLEAPAVTGSLEEGAAVLRWTGAGEVYQVFKANELHTPGAANSAPA